MTEWISFNDKYPDKFPCKARNYNLKIEDIIIVIDNSNKAFNHACFCNSLPTGISMPFTHWMELPD